MERNHCTFEGVDAFLMIARIVFVRTLFESSHVLGHSDICSIIDCIGSLSFRS